MGPLTTDWRALAPGRELDVIVAERVMGWTRVVGPCAENNGEAFGAPPELIADGTIPKDHGRVRVPRFSTDIAAAWLIMDVLGGIVTVKRMADAWYCGFGEGVTAWADTAPHAIVLAALAALDSETRGEG